MRQIGKTTRAIDDAVQKLFEGETLFFATKSFISQDDQDTIRGRKCKIFEKEEYKKHYEKYPMFDPDWREGRAQQDFIHRFLARLYREHNLTLNKAPGINGLTISLQDFKKG